MAFSGAIAKEYCRHCLSIDHKSQDCKKAGDKTEKGKKVSGQPCVPMCKDWNNGRRRSATCEFKHLCMECHGDHPGISCYRQRARPYYRPDRPTRSFQANKSSFRGGGGPRQRSLLRPTPPPMNICTITILEQTYVTVLWGSTLALNC